MASVLIHPATYDTVRPGTLPGKSDPIGLTKAESITRTVSRLEL